MEQLKHPYQIKIMNKDPKYDDVENSEYDSISVPKSIDYNDDDYEY